MDIETFTIIEVLEYAKPLLGNAKAIKIHIADRTVILPLYGRWEPNVYKEIWKYKDGYKQGTAYVQWYSDARVWGEVVQVEFNADYSKPVDERIDLKDVLKQYEDINQSIR